MPFRKPLVESKILMVDDEPVNLKLLNKMLTSKGYLNLFSVSDSRYVIDEYKNINPDLILLDINMPHFSGFEVMEQLKSLDDPLLPPILILTAQQGRDYLLQALSLGARDLISKPFDSMELLMRVRNLLELHQNHVFMHDQKSFLDLEVKKRTCELEQTRQAVIRRLGQAAEFRDNETGFHIVRMSQYSSLLAESMGWNKIDVELMLNASPMHDIGKIGIPDEILQKPGKLNADEWGVMKEHPNIGASLLSDDDSPLFKLAREIAATHHEKWNGEGYPLGLAGESIPLSGRIVAVADVFDALTSSRPYKKAWSDEEAINFIQKESGKHFDPEVVRHFVKCLPQILDIKARYVEQTCFEVA